MSVTGALSIILFPLLFLPVYIQRCRLSQHNRFSLPAFTHCLYVAVRSALLVDGREVERRGYAFLGWQRHGARCCAVPPLTKQHLLLSCAAPLNQPCLFFCHRQWHAVFDGILSAHHFPSVAPLCMSLSIDSLPSSQVLSQRPSTVPVRLVSAALLVSGSPVEAYGCACLGLQQSVAHCFICVALPFARTLLPESISREPACDSCHQQVRRGLNPRSAATDQHVRFFAHFSCQVLLAVRDALMCMCCDWF